jgi:cell division protein FtsB
MILEFLALPLARRILGGALVFAALTAIVFTIYHAGTHAGAAAEASRQVAAGKASFERVEADVRRRLDAASAREQQLATLVDKLTSNSAAASARAAAAQSVAAADRARITALSDPALRSDLAQRLGAVIPSGGPMRLIGPQSKNPSASASNPSAAGKYVGDGNSPLSNPVNSAAALRAIDARLSDCEHLSEQTAALTQQVAALTARDAARDAQLTATASERDAVLDAYNQLVPLYAQAFRVATQRRRRWFCLFLCSTGPRLTLPPPLTLHPPLSPPTH